MISFITLEPAANVSSASSHILPASRRDLSSPRTSIATSAPADIHACLSRSVTEAGKTLPRASRMSRATEGSSDRLRGVSGRLRLGGGQGLARLRLRFVDQGLQLVARGGRVAAG